MSGDSLPLENLPSSSEFKWDLGMVPGACSLHLDLKYSSELMDLGTPQKFPISPSAASQGHPQLQKAAHFPQRI